MFMELIFLGTSSAIPSRYRNHSALALKAFGELILFDCGEGTQRQMIKSKLSPMKIKKIFITHLHGDHILGIPGIIQSLGFRGRTEKLKIYGPKGISLVINSMLNLGYFSLKFDIEVHEIKTGQLIDEEQYQINCVKTDHSIPNYSFAIIEKKKPRFLKQKALELGIKPGPDFGKLHRGLSVEVNGQLIKPEQVLGKKRKGKKIVYSGDTRPSEALIHLAKDADILIHESTFQEENADKAEETLHSTSTDAAQVAKRAQVKQLILTHISSRYKKSQLLENSAKEIFKNSMVAEDLMVVKVK